MVSLAPFQMQYQKNSLLCINGSLWLADPCHGSVLPTEWQATEGSLLIVTCIQTTTSRQFIVDGNLTKMQIVVD